MTNRPAPTAPRKAPDRSWIGLLLIAVLMIGMGVGAGMIVTRTANSAPDDPLAGRPRVTDTAAGVSYGIPVGWEEANPDSSVLQAPFSSAIGCVPGASPDGFVAVAVLTEAGSPDTLARDYLKVVAAMLVGYEDTGDEPSAEPDIQIDGRRAAVTSFTLDIPQGEGSYDLRAVVFVGPKATVLVLTLAHSERRAAMVEDIQNVLASMRLL